MQPNIRDYAGLLKTGSEGGSQEVGLSVLNLFSPEKTERRWSHYLAIFYFTNRLRPRAT